MPEFLEAIPFVTHFPLVGLALACIYFGVYITKPKNGNQWVTKEDFAKLKEQNDREHHALEEKLDKVAEDVAYIKGHLENKKE